MKTLGKVAIYQEHEYEFRQKVMEDMHCIQMIQSH